ncbi:hypothetical protein RKD34_003963 [Streptomyces sp. SAI-218]
MTVGREAHIAFEGVRPVLDRFAVRGESVLGSVFRGSAVGDDLSQLLPCVGHRVMVPPLGGTRANGGISIAPHLSCMAYIKSSRRPTGTAYGALTARGKS